MVKHGKAKSVIDKLKTLWEHKFVRGLKLVMIVMIMASNSYDVGILATMETLNRQDVKTP